MHSRPFDLEHHLQQHGTALRELAGELVRDGAQADEAVQEVWLRAVRRPPRHEASIGGWLATMLKHVVSSLRRGERRRFRREQVVAAARGEVAEDHAVSMARAELAQRLLTAVTELDAPFREAIWQRYFEGKAPREIAAAGGVPVATVKSRLQRGLRMLREKLGNDGASDWRAGLVVAFGLREGAGIGMAAAAWPGVLLMTAWMKSAAAVLLVAGAGLLWWTLRDPWAPLSVAAAVAPAGANAVVADLGAKPAVKAELAASPSVAERTSAPPTAAASDPRNATLRGRCVDESGAPLAGCKVYLRGSVASSERLDVWLRDHDQPPRVEPDPQTTLADGAFSFTFLPPPPFQFFLDVHREGCGNLAGRWSKIEEGATLAVGDVVVRPGVRVVGRVVDSDGQPQAGVVVSIQQQRSLQDWVPRKGPIGPAWGTSLSSEADGAFTSRHWLTPGTYCVETTNRLMAAPMSITLALDPPPAELIVVVQKEVDLPTITGRVLDEAGMPVRGASIETLAANDRERTVASSLRDGAFVLRRPRNITVETATLKVVAEGFEPAAPVDSVRWGTSGVELRVVRGIALTVRVTGPDGQPVPKYSVRVIPREPTGWSSSEARVRARGPFVDGTASIVGITRGKWMVVVDFPSETGFLKLLGNVEVSTQGPNRVDLMAHVATQRMLRVVSADGMPVVGTQVQLCELFGGAFGPRTPVLGEDLWLTNIQNLQSALVLFEGATDTEGRLRLSGPGEHGLGLRVLGPGHLPVEQSGLRLDAEQELVVTVARGARLRGRITDKAAIDELLRMTIPDVADGPRAFPAGRRPTVSLRGAAGSLVSEPLDRRDASQVAIQDDGSFDVGGLPPGTWQLEVCYHEMQRHGIGLIGTTKRCVISQVDLRDGQTTQVDTDLASILPGTLEGEVLLNGRPLPGAVITLQPHYGQEVGLGGDRDWINLESDAEGRFTHRGRNGDYQLLVQRIRDNQLMSLLRAADSARVVQGKTTRHVFMVRAGELELKVVDASGKPVPGIHVAVVEEDWSLPPTGADGRVRAELTEQSITLRVLPKRLLTPEARATVLREGGTAGQRDPFAPFWLTLGTATITAAETTTLELRLPPEWEK